jgi:Xaa-Pro aminopeptidase
VKPAAIDSSLFRENRKRLLQLLPQNSLAILNANDLLPTNADASIAIPNSDLFYLSGVTQEESILLLAPNAFEERHREILFLREPNELMTIWEGHKLTKEEASRISGIANIQWLSQFPPIFRTLMCEAGSVFLNTNEHQRADALVETRDARFIAECQRRYPLHHYQRLAPLLHQLRTVKSAPEIELIRSACALTGKGFRRVLNFVKPGVNETEIEAEFAHEFIRGFGCFAYPPIIAAGINNCILHYEENNQTCKKGDLILMDVAAGKGGYMSDLTRTIPANGRFSKRQRQVYDATLRIFRAMLRTIAPGKTTRDLRAECDELTTKECVDLGLIKPSQLKRAQPGGPAVRKYFMHGVSHPLGLDVHDVAYNHDKIQPGWVLTCEPGIYIQEEGFGIRLENTVAVTENGIIDLMADIPIEPDEIESLMTDKRA